MPVKLKERSPRRFGIEIEFVGGPLRYSEWGNALRDIQSQRGRPFVARVLGGYGHSDSISWDLKTDSSCGMEIASPALTWDRWDEVELVCGMLQAGHAIVDDRCGLHVHVEVRDFRRPAIKRLALLWGALEDVAFGMCQPQRRRNQYCRGLRQELPWNVYRAICNSSLPRHIRGLGRRCALNMTQWWRRGTVEFRLFHGSIDAEEIKQWVMFVQVLVDLAKRRIRATTIDRLAGGSCHEQMDWLRRTITTYYEHPDVMTMVYKLKFWKGETPASAATTTPDTVPWSLAIDQRRASARQEVAEWLRGIRVVRV